MDKLKEEIKSGRKMTERSLTAYLRNIEKLDKKNPFSVPDNYFTTLTHEIVDMVDRKDTLSFLNILQIKTLATSLMIITIIFSGIWYNNQNPEITEDDLVELLSFYQIEDELLLEYFESESEEIIDQDLLDQFYYNELIYEL